MKQFIIEYKCLDINGNVIQEGKVKAKNKLSKFQAMCGFEEHLKKKHFDFGKLIVVKCEEDSIEKLFSDLFKMAK